MSEFENESNEEFDELGEQYQADQDEFNSDDEQDEFFQTYGFKHECHCADDWEAGNLGVVSVCYLQMIQDAMEALKETRESRTKAEAECAGLRVKLVEAGVDPDA